MSLVNSIFWQRNHFFEYVDKIKSNVSLVNKLVANNVVTPRVSIGVSSKNFHDYMKEFQKNKYVTIKAEVDTIPFGINETRDPVGIPFETYKISEKGEVLAYVAYSSNLELLYVLSLASSHGQDYLYNLFWKSYVVPLSSGGQLLHEALGSKEQDFPNYMLKIFQHVATVGALEVENVPGTFDFPRGRGKSIPTSFNLMVNGTSGDLSMSYIPLREVFEPHITPLRAEMYRAAPTYHEVLVQSSGIVYDSQEVDCGYYEYRKGQGLKILHFGKKPE